MSLLLRGEPRRLIPERNLIVVSCLFQALRATRPNKYSLLEAVTCLSEVSLWSSMSLGTPCKLQAPSLDRVAYRPTKSVMLQTEHNSLPWQEYKDLPPQNADGTILVSFRMVSFRLPNSSPKASAAH